MLENFLENLNFNWSLMEETDSFQVFKVIFNKAKNKKLIFLVEYVKMNTAWADGYWISNPSAREVNSHNLILSDLKKIVRKRGRSYKKINYFIGRKGKSLAGEFLV